MQIQYVDDGDVAVFDGLSFRKDKRTGYYLNAKTHKRLHVYVWEHFNGPVPKGYEIHHIDMDKTHNELENLQLLTSREHRKIHGEMLTDEQRNERRRRMNELARPKAIEWHKSEEGRKWHSIHGKDAWVGREVREYICTNCGKKFETINAYPKGSNHFCSNNCKSAYRRRMGFDDVDKICESCGATYRENKYQKSKFCPGCRNRRRGRA